MVIGGGEIYKTFSIRPNASISPGWKRSRGRYFFPELDPKEWHLMSHKDHEADEKNAYNYSFQVWERIR